MKNNPRAKYTGKLIVFEGPDGVGKTTLAISLANELRRCGQPSKYFSFPGREKHSLGALVYKLHHKQSTYGIKCMDSASLQILHVASHIDEIRARILPTLANGCNVVLDRYWWSTWVYGTSERVDSSLLSKMLALEDQAWNGLKPSVLILINRQRPYVGKASWYWNSLNKEYARLYERETLKYPVIKLCENGEPPKELLAVLLHSIRPHLAAKDCEFVVDFHIKLSPAKTTIVYDTYWRFATERQNIFLKKLQKPSPPWTEDPILSEYKFTNAYRVCDRVSQYLLRYVIYQGDQSPSELFFRIILFKIFNKIDTWELFLNRFGGVISYREFSTKNYDAVLTEALSQSKSVYSAAYIMPSGGSASGYKRKHAMHLHLIQAMMRDDLPSRIAEAKTMGKAFEMLRAYPTIGDFLAFQYLIDLNYSTLLNFSEMDFVVAGPGAKDGLKKCFCNFGGLTEGELIKVVTECQAEEFNRLDLKFQTLWGRPLQLIDCQNLFCEVDKYSRIKHPEFTGGSGRTRIKQRYRCNLNPIPYFFPPKWGLNEKVPKMKSSGSGCC